MHECQSYSNTHIDMRYVVAMCPGGTVRMCVCEFCFRLITINNVVVKL